MKGKGKGREGAGGRGEGRGGPLRNSSIFSWIVDWFLNVIVISLMLLG